MFKNMSLSMKIGVGFGALIVIAVALGTLAVWNMKSVEMQSTVLAKEYMPEVAVANEIERNAQQTMYNIRGYMYSEEQGFLTDGKKYLAEMKKSLDGASQLADRSSHLASLKDAAARGSGKVQEYEQLFEQTCGKMAAIDKDRATLIEIAGRYVKNCDELMNGEMEALKKEVGTGGDASKLPQHLAKLALVNEAIDLVSTTRIAFWKGTAQRQTKLFDDAIANFDLIDKKLDELKALTSEDAQLKQIEQMRADGVAYRTTLADLITNWQARDEIGKKRGAAATGVLEQAKTIAESGMSDTDKVAASSVALLSTASLVMIIGLGVAALVGALLALFITRAITKPINRIIAGLDEGADQVNDAAAQVSTASQQLAEGASEQASSLEETSSALEEMAAMTRTNAENAKQANELSEQAKTAAQDGDKTMGRLNVSMTGINESSNQISKIIKVIEEIAFQTNLLALNAAVEAARAGEHGKGFAVVAEEVRNLAQRAAQASREITGLIEDSVSKAREGTSVAGEVGQALATIVADVGKVADLVNGITRASQEQAQGVEQVNTAVSQMDKVTQQNAAGAEESASAAEEMAAQAQAVKGMVAELATVIRGARTGGARMADPTPVVSSKVKQRLSARTSAQVQPMGHAAPPPSHTPPPTPTNSGELAQF